MLGKHYFILFWLVLLTTGLMAQNYLWWSDDFNDDDSLASKNVGWLYLGEEQGVKNVIIRQRNNALFVQQGSYELYPGLGIGIGIIETNGIPVVYWDNIDSTNSLIIKNNYCDPNHVLSFKVRFNRWRNLGDGSSFFSINTRLPISEPDSVGVFIFSDATVEPAYALALWPITGEVVFGRYDSTLYAALFPNEAWNIFGKTNYKFELNKDYWIKYYLNEGDIRVKIWDTGPQNEPANWLLTHTDPAPRVSGKFIGFGILGPFPAPGTEDQVFLDDIKVEGWREDVSVSKNKMTFPNTFQLEQNFPNPFNPVTDISFYLPQKALAKLTIYNLCGERVCELINSELATGWHRLNWNGRNQFDQPVASGIYFYQLIANGNTLTRQMLLMR